MTVVAALVDAHVGARSGMWQSTHCVRPARCQRDGGEMARRRPRRGGTGADAVAPRAAALECGSWQLLHTTPARTCGSARRSRRRRPRRESARRGGTGARRAGTGGACRTAAGRGDRCRACRAARGSARSYRPGAGPPGFAPGAMGPRLRSTATHPRSRPGTAGALLSLARLFIPGEPHVFRPGPWQDFAGHVLLAKRRGEAASPRRSSCVDRCCGTPRTARVPVLVGAGPVQRVRVIACVVRVQVVPALPAVRRGTRIPGDGKRLQPAAGEGQEVLLQRIDAEHPGHGVVLQRAIGPVGAHDDSRPSRRVKARLDAVVDKARVVEIAEHGVPRGLLHGEVVV
jgi:hypothetical protein